MQSGNEPFALSAAKRKHLISPCAPGGCPGCFARVQHDM